MVKNAAEAMVKAVRLQAMYLHQCGQWRIFLCGCSLGVVPSECFPPRDSRLQLLFSGCGELSPVGVVVCWSFGVALTNITVIKMTGGKRIKLLIKLVNSSCVVNDIGPRVMVLAALLVESYVWYLKCRTSDVRLAYPYWSDWDFK